MKDTLKSDILTYLHGKGLRGATLRTITSDLQLRIIEESIDKSVNIIVDELNILVENGFIEKCPGMNSEHIYRIRKVC